MLQALKENWGFKLINREAKSILQIFLRKFPNKRRPIPGKIRLIIPIKNFKPRFNWGKLEFLVKFKPLRVIPSFL